MHCQGFIRRSPVFIIRRHVLLSLLNLGCGFIWASVEYPAPSHPVLRAAREHKEMIRSYLGGLGGEVEGADPMILSEQLYLLFEGAITASQLHGEPWPAGYARKAAAKLLAESSFEPRLSAKQTKYRETANRSPRRLGTARLSADGELAFSRGRRAEFPNAEPLLRS